MSVERRTRTEPDKFNPRHRISHEGSKVAASRHNASRQAVRDAMEKIEKELSKHGGIYPKGKITKQLLLEKAGLSPAYLEKPTPKMKAFKRNVDAWIEKIAQVSPGNTDAIRRAVTAKVDAAREETRAVRQACAEAELEHAQTIADLAEARGIIEELKEQNARLLKQLAGKKVIPIDRGALK